MARRVETLSLVDDANWQRRITFDIDVHELRVRASKFGLVGEQRVPVPLLTLEKKPLIDVDITDAGGRSLPVAVSDQGAHIAAAVVLSLLRDESLRVEDLPTEVLWQIYSVVREKDSARLLEVLYAAVPEVFDEPLGDDGRLVLTPTEKLAWEQLLNSDVFFDVLTDFAANYLLIVQVPLADADDVEILKVRIMEARDPAVAQTGRFSFDRLGWAPQVLTIPVSLGTAQRNHVRVLAPPDSAITSARLLEDRDGVAHPVTPNAFDTATGPVDRATMYGAAIPAGDYGAEFSIEPSRDIFLVPAAFSMFFMSVLLGFALFFQTMDQRFSGRGVVAYLRQVTPEISGLRFVDLPEVNFDAAVTVLALVPSAVAIYLVRSGEHRAFSRSMTLPRLLVLAGASATILAAGATAADVSAESLSICYSAALAVVLVALVAVCVPLIRIGRVLRSRAGIRRR